jgi:hypothetical protein
MSDEYNSDNNEGAMIGFYKKFNYQLTVSTRSRGATNLVNFGFAEKALYGRVDRHYVPIVINKTNAPLRSTAIATATERAPSALPFVIDAFGDLALQFQKSIMAGKISPTDTFLSNPKVYSAYEDPKLLYGKHLTSFTAGIRTSFRKNNKTFRNFDEFLPLFTAALKSATTIHPYTYPAYIKHRLCPINVSGLAIEIADLDFSNDEEKVARFVNSGNWLFYLNACRSYGFSVDLKAPWRLVADIGSPEMIKYSRKYGFPTTDSILSVGFQPAHIEYYNGFKVALAQAYNALKLANYLEPQHCGGTTTIPKLVTPDSYTAEQLEKRYNEGYFLDLYFKIRLWEEESKFTEDEEKTLIDDALALYRAKGAGTALSAFERVIGRTQDYSGSLTKYERRAILRYEEELRRQELRGAVSTYR